MDSGACDYRCSSGRRRDRPGRTAKNLYAVERDRDDKQQQSDQRADAALVHAWTAVWLWGDSDDREDGLVIVNGSSRPVYEMKVSSRDAYDKEKPRLHLSVVPPGEYFVADDPTYKWGFPDLVSQRSGMMRPIMKKREWRVTALEFSDINDITWERLEGGDLNKVDKECRPVQVTT